MKSMNFADKVFRFTAENALFSTPCHLIVAVSGGPDSMALLHTLLHWPQEGLRLSVVHMNHGLRGELAQRDEAFVQQYCAEHNLPFFVYREDVASYATQHKLSLEEAGRTLRYRRFEELRQEVDADYIVTAHTVSDQAETMLMHLIRGCGLDALRGIPAKRDRICRPLLSCTREEVLEYCRDKSVPYVTDETNQDTRFTRNRVRHEVIPLLQEINPNVVRSLLRFQEHITEDVDYLESLSQELLSQATNGDRFRVAPLVAAAQPIRRRAIRLLLRAFPFETVEEAHICAIEHILLAGSGRSLLPGKCTAHVQNGFLTITKTGEIATENTVHLAISDLPVTFAACNKQYTVSLNNSPDFQNVHNLFANYAIDYDKIQGGLTIRTRKIGDTLCPAGRGITKSIKKLMNEWKIPAELRDYYPLVCDESGVLLVPGYACDQRAAVTEVTQRYLVIESQ